MTSEQIKSVRTSLGMSQQAFAAALGVSFATVNRWENGKAKPQKDRIERMKILVREAESQSPEPDLFHPLPVRLDFEGDAHALKLVVDAHRLQNGHLFNKAFALELSRIVPLPHQRIAVYEHMVPQNPLRFLLADDAGAGKTIMTGLYIREMINRGRLRRAIICAPAGLTWNWRRELRHFFDLEFVVLRSADFSKGDPLTDPAANLFIISIDTAATQSVRERLLASTTASFDLAVFDEAHKLSWADPNRPDSRTRRYRLAEGLSQRATHLLLLTATPHMGKRFPYYALWRLLAPQIFSTFDAWDSHAEDNRPRYFIRRLKEEMVDYHGQPIYKPRLCQTISFRLSSAEQRFYDAATDYLQWSYENNRTANKNAAAMVVAVLQRRLASSTYAMIESLKRRREKVLEGAPHSESVSLDRIAAYLDTSTADEYDVEGGAAEAEENVESQALGLVRPSTSAQIRKELEYIDRVIALGDQVRDLQQETKFLKLRELVESAEFRHHQLLIFTEHRDTLEYLKQRFEALGYTGQIAYIHGGMDVEEREYQRVLFMPPDTRRELGIKDPEGPTARFMLATDAAGEGINLQFAWVMVNFDIPWNPARLEQRMGRLHRFGQRHSEVRIFSMVAEGTREGDVLATLLDKLEEARKDLCSDKVFDVVGQQLQEVSLRDLMREALFEHPPYSAQRKLDTLLATQRLRAAVEEQRKSASTYGDVARRLGQLNSEIEVERFNRLLPAFVQNFVEKAAPRFGIQIQGDLVAGARFAPEGPEGTWLRNLSSRFPDGLPEFITVRRDSVLPGVDASRICFLRPGDLLFDTLCEQVIRKFHGDVQRGAVFCDPAAERPYLFAVYSCQLGEGALSEDRDGRRALFDRRLIGIRWDAVGEFSSVASNYLLALQPAPKALLWKAGTLLLNPEDNASRADSYARMVAETTHLQQLRSALRAQTEAQVDDLLRGFDFQMAALAEKRSDLARRIRLGEEDLAPQLDEVKRQQEQMEAEKARTLLYEQRRPDLIDIAKLERVALALVVPDPTPEAREAYDKDIEAVAMRIARNFEVDRYQARVFDVSAPNLARGYDLESHRASGEKVVIEVKGRAGRGPVQLTENEWPTAANVRDKYWLYVVADCATDPKLFRVRDPIRLAFRTRQSFSINIGEIIREAEPE
ncbi:MAG TPA: helicase-related protein [Bryobacteraceae bacterium]|nr:helicase-related protein [Bryobacteraceae bacterium]